MAFPSFSALIILFASATLSVAAAQSASPSGAKPCTDKIFRDFDFWVGEWEVFLPDGTKAGDNSVTIEEGGCLIVERWKSVSGGTGQSYNYVDLATNKWRQVWVGAGATIDNSGGLNDAGEMALEGVIGYANNPSAPLKGRWTPLENGDVQQYFEQFDDASQSWQPWFTGIYKKKNTD